MGMIDKEDAKKAICECCYMFKYIGDSYTECKYYPCAEIKALEAIPSAEQVTSKLKKPCDSLLTGDSDECKEIGSKLEATEAEEYEDYEHATLVDIKEPLKASAEAIQGYKEWLEKIIVMLEPEYLCEDTTDKEWCEDNCHYSSIQAECLRHLYKTNQVTSKLKNPCDSLLTDDSADAKEQKSKLESADDTFCKSQLITCNRVKECNGVCPFEDALKHADKMQTMNEQHTVDHDRDWIIGCLEHDGFIHTHRFDKANQIILDALSAVQGWIPCSERLPLVGGEFLVTLVDNDGTWVSTAQWNMTFGGRWQDIFPNDGYRDISNVIAWKTLPTPYTKEDNE